MNLNATDLDCEIQILKQTRFDENLFALATSHNNTLKLMRQEGDSLTELYALESLPGQVLSLETSSVMKRLFLGGNQFQTVLDFTNA